MIVDKNPFALKFPFVKIKTLFGFVTVTLTLFVASVIVTHHIHQISMAFDFSVIGIRNSGMLHSEFITQNHITEK